MAANQPQSGLRLLHSATYRCINDLPKAEADAILVALYTQEAPFIAKEMRYRYAYIGGGAHGEDAARDEVLALFENIRCKLRPRPTTAAELKQWAIRCYRKLGRKSVAARLGSRRTGFRIASIDDVLEEDLHKHRAYTEISLPADEVSLTEYGIHPQWVAVIDTYGNGASWPDIRTAVNKRYGTNIEQEALKKSFYRLRAALQEPVAKLLAGQIVDCAQVLPAKHFGRKPIGHSCKSAASYLAAEVITFFVCRLHLRRSANVTRQALLTLPALA